MERRRLWLQESWRARLRIEGGRQRTELVQGMGRMGWGVGELGSTRRLYGWVRGRCKTRIEPGRRSLTFAQHAHAVQQMSQNGKRRTTNRFENAHHRLQASQ